MMQLWTDVGESKSRYFLFLQIAKGNQTQKGKTQETNVVVFGNEILHQNTHDFTSSGRSKVDNKESLTEKNKIVGEH